MCTAWLACCSMPHTYTHLDLSHTRCLTITYTSTNSPTATHSLTYSLTRSYSGHGGTCLQEFPWIATEKDFFGKPGSDYDFEAQDVPAAFEEYEAANQSLQRLSNKVNRKVWHS